MLKIWKRVKRGGRGGAVRYNCAGCVSGGFLDGLLRIE